LLDTIPDKELENNIRASLETGADRISDLHLWRVGPGHHAAIICIVADHPQAPAVYKDKLAGLSGLSHVTVEVAPCS
jgi:Co/Zn/Cd efflux system component